VAVLTDTGWDVVRKLAPGHVDAVREAVFEPLDAEQARAFGEALNLILERLDPDHSLRFQDPGREAGSRGRV
jgi:hypothetical protein